MHDFYYVNSNGRKIDFRKTPYIGLMSNDLFGFEWDYITQGQAVQKIVKFEKRMKSKTFQVVVVGKTDKEYRENLDKFLQLTDVDINNLQMGRLYVGDYYLECYIYASSKKSRYVGTNKTLIECTIICENGNWQSDEKWKFFAGIAQGEGETTGNGIVYPYDYELDPLTHEVMGYDYSAPFGRNTIINESYMDTDFEMVFYGPALLPEVKIGGYEYRINYELSASDYLVINSRAKTCTVVKYNGTRVNVFKYRDRNWNIFEKIKSGGNLVIISDNQALDVTLFYERSEPFWGDQKWT
jgi:hypothetical protein